MTLPKNKILTDRHMAVFRAIAAACRAKAVTPSRDELSAASGVVPGSVGWCVRHIIACGVVQSVKTKGSYPAFALPGTKHRTKPRPRIIPPCSRDLIAAGHARRMESAGGWPKITAESRASYDRAVRYRLFAMHEMGAPAAQAPRVHGTAMHPVPVYSLTGNAAAMCAP